MSLCAWCGLPATATIELEPVRFGTVYDQRIHAPRKMPIRAAITVPVCAHHAHIRTRKGGRQMPDPRKRGPRSTQTPLFPPEDAT